MKSAISQAVTKEAVLPKFSQRGLIPGMLALASTAPAAYMIHLINNAYTGQPERAATVVGEVFSVLFVLPAASYFLLRGRAINPGRLGLIVLITAGLILVSIYLYWVSFFVFFPADILLWSESDFVNDILKFRLGYPIYSAQANNESFMYTPGAQILTYMLARLTGAAASIPYWRMIQLGYVLLASIAAVSCCRRLVEMNLPEGKTFEPGLWSALWLPVFFLISTNPLTNAYVHTLHNDALALLISVAAYWLLLKYISMRNVRVLMFMALVPAAGFLVKQSLVIWAPIYIIHLILFDRPRSVARALTFAAACFASVGLVLGGCYLLWGEHFTYWIFTAMGNDPVSPLRSFQHIMDAWTYFAIGLLGGFVLVRSRNFNLLLGAWAVWLFLIFVEGSSSGIGWMMNHMGPGSLIAGIWFMAALVRIWSSVFPSDAIKYGPQNWLRAGITLAVVGLLFNGLGFIKVPVKHFPDDTYRYISEIEEEFKGLKAEEVLLDAGTWVYFKEGVIMKDRGLAFGSRGLSGTGDFSGMIKRLEGKRYSKIIVRNLDSPLFLYDHWLWPESSGIRKTLLENYRLNGSIRAVEDKVHEKAPYLFFDEISILVPKTS